MDQNNKEANKNIGCAKGEKIIFCGNIAMTDCIREVNFLEGFFFYYLNCLEILSLFKSAFQILCLFESSGFFLNKDRTLNEWLISAAVCPLEVLKSMQLRYGFIAIMILYLYV